MFLHVGCCTMQLFQAAGSSAYALLCIGVMDDTLAAAYHWQRFVRRAKAGSSRAQARSDSSARTSWLCAATASTALPATLWSPYSRLLKGARPMPTLLWHGGAQ